MQYSPFTSVGQVQAELAEVRGQLHRKVDSGELDLLSSKVSKLESDLREFCYRLERVELQLRNLEEPCQ